MKKAFDKEEIYTGLAKMYGWSAEIVAELNPYQQIRYLRGPRIQTYGTIEDLKAAGFKIQERPQKSKTK